MVPLPFLQQHFIVLVFLDQSLRPLHGYLVSFHKRRISASDVFFHACDVESKANGDDDTAGLKNFSAPAKLASMMKKR